ncbi:mitochondrial inner membrane protein OXA1L isoform X1 [Bombus pyrosoma]|uniref:mitochondrial inner membrane protein OXA1L isoform X1 n=1 Tax=Bombus pyrosoma TaxID=396416 RepID=UPI001CB9B60E|nr:mitochondrial inner membrane protein OXA1L isoform X1 [Bombus pyrosoma]
MLTRLCVRVSQKLLNTNTGFHKTTECRFSGLAYNITNGPLKRDCVLNVHILSKIHKIYFARYESTANTTIKENVSNTPPDSSVSQTQITDLNNSVPEKDLLSEIPDPPLPQIPLPTEITEVIKLHANGEPTFESLGLGGYGPMGIIQTFYELLHINCDLPWWATIVLTSVLIKLATFPCSIIVQRNTSNMSKILPQMIRLQENMTEARNCGNSQEATVYAFELQELLKKNNVKMFPVSNLLKVGAHLPIFFALRQMTNKPVESLKEGGLWWFMDLTSTDPYYLLPLGTSITLYAVTSHALKSSPNLTPIIRNMFKAVPVISFLFAMKFPGAILCHWTVSNILTVIENQVIRLEKVRAYFNIPLIQQATAKNTVKKDKGFKESFSDAWTNMKISNRLASYAHADLKQFNNAAKGPLTKTYKYNPVKNLSKATSATSMTTMKK